MVRPFRFGVQASRAATMTAWREQAQWCEDVGYACLYMPDHFGDQFGPLVALTVAAEATTTLRVGSLVFDNDYRHPVVLAKEIATLDLASNGRVEFGLGAGWMETDYAASGIPYDAPGVRVDRMVEGLAVMRALWAGERATFCGRHYMVEDASGLPRPYTSPHPPILIGGGSRRILSIAAREADVVGVNLDLRSGRVGAEVMADLVPERWEERIGWVRDAAGARLADIDIQVLTFVVRVGTPYASAAPEVASLLSVAPETVAEIPLAMVGTVDEICDQLIARRERWGYNSIVVHAGDADAIAPVVRLLAGR